MNSAYIDRYQNLEVDEQWCQDHKTLFKNLEPGTVYTFFKTESPVPMKQAGKLRYRSQYKRLDDGTIKRYTQRISALGNDFIRHISICPDCGTLKSSKRMKSAVCARCLEKRRSKRMLKKYYTKKTNRKYVTKASKAKPRKSRRQRVCDIVERIAGTYQKVERKWLKVDAFEDLWEEKIYADRKV